MPRALFHPDLNIIYRITKGKIDSSHVGELCHPVLDANGNQKTAVHPNGFRYIMVQLVDCPENVERLYIPESWIEQIEKGE